MSDTLSESEVFDVLYAIERGEVVLASEGPVWAEDDATEVAFVNDEGWRLVVLFEEAEWGGLTSITAPDGRELRLGEGEYTLDHMSDLCDYAPDADTIERCYLQAPSAD